MSIPRPAISSKRPRSSSSIRSEDVFSPRKKARGSSVQAASSPGRSPLIRSRRLSSEVPDLSSSLVTGRLTPAPSVTPAPTSALGKAATATNDKDTEPETSPPTVNLPVAKRRPRLSLPAPEPDRPHREGTVDSGEPAEDAEDFAELLRDGFSLQEAALFQRIQKRGFEPLMPAHWQVDFSTMPDHLFTAADDPAYIESITLDGTFNATTAFQTLVNLGGFVRGKLEGKHDAEAKIVSSLRKYIQWSVDDAKMAGFEIHPLIAISSSQGKDPAHCENRMDKKLHEIAKTLRSQDSHLSISHPRPETSSSTVYGLAVAGCVAALITLNARDEKAPTRTMLVVDFSEANTDFWNAISIALLVIAARDDELERVDFYRDRGVERGWKVGQVESWQAKGRRRGGVEDEDEDA
ncbi:unnamed protein product [Tuber melanosporum]|uniref:(Perigord truffle) hypothetical protein n=1 Tax=Tuber melanosporum (strain Mel28) TaxID=656061 RepID=D5GEU3_TUBMM|nr:uncharacterized protein GSTUM_00001396001 [Tuber melanosporum]CAZ83036.1 unnamed protein product [Tuber melanosporum]